MCFFIYLLKFEDQLIYISLTAYRKSYEGENKGVNDTNKGVSVTNRGVSIALNMIFGESIAMLL
jgi:hypothetical protein